MENFFINGLEILEYISKIRTPFLNYFFYFLSFLGSEKFYLIILPLLFWCIDEKGAYKLTILFFISYFINDYLKSLFKIPRPFSINKNIAIAYEESFSFPSAHSQGSATIYGAISLRFKGFLKILFLIFLPILIALSRIYLGVHYPIDIICGLIIGYFFVFLFSFFEKRIENFFENRSFLFKLVIIIVLDFLLIIIKYNSTSITGAFFGLSFGYILYNQINDVKKNNRTSENEIILQKKGIILKKLIKYIIGLVFIFIFYFGGSVFYSKNHHDLKYYIFSYIKYLIIGFWISFVYPLIYNIIISKLNFYGKNRY
ncbi:MAG: phosphatase PAP2 family protein [Spirochaetes bacterium]|nr:phosphatase PAP2 family protein [Spirochaetota bacterium]